MKKIFSSFVLAFVLFSTSLPVFAAASGTVLPSTTKSVEECKTVMNKIQQKTTAVRKEIFGENKTVDGLTADNILACGIRTGDIHLWMIPYYIRYILEFIIGIAGLVAVGGIVYGGYLYLFAGVSDDKDKGKKSIMYGVAGMILTLVAWAVVNIFVSFFAG